MTNEIKLTGNTHDNQLLSLAFTTITTCTSIRISSL